MKLGGTDDASVILPRSYPDIAGYQPFPDEFDRIVNGILSEEQSLESPEEDEWQSPITFSRSIQPASFTPINSPAKMGATQSSWRRPKVATRNITKVDMEDNDDSQEDQDMHRSMSALQDEYEDDASMHDADDYEEVPYSAGGYDERSIEPPKPKSPSPMATAPMTTEMEKETGWKSDLAEEDIIFLSVGQTERTALLDFIAWHPFLRGAHQPLKTSERLEFVEELRSKAVAAGMSDDAIFGLVHYVRRIYLTTAGVAVEPLPYRDIAFGTEIEETPVTQPEEAEQQSMTQEPTTSENKLERHKRNLSNTDHIEEAALKKKKKKNKHRSREPDELLQRETSLQPAWLSDSSLPESLDFIMKKNKKSKNKQKVKDRLQADEKKSEPVVVQIDNEEEQAPEEQPKQTKTPKKPTPGAEAKSPKHRTVEQIIGSIRHRAVELWGEANTAALFTHVQSSKTSREISRILHLKPTRTFYQAVQATNQSMINRLCDPNVAQKPSNWALKAKHPMTCDFKEAHRLLTADPSLEVEITSDLLGQLGLCIEPSSGLLIADVVAGGLDLE